MRQVTNIGGDSDVSICYCRNIGYADATVNNM